MRSWERPVPEPGDVGSPNDLGLAVAVLDNHDPVLVGETRFLPNAPGEKMQYWAFVHRYDSSGGFESWTSPEIFNTAGAYAVARDDDNGLLVAGWTSQNGKIKRPSASVTKRKRWSRCAFVSPPTCKPGWMLWA